MAGWTAASLFPSSLIRNAINPQLTEAQMQALTPEQKLRLSGGVTRRALTEPRARALPESRITPSSVVIPGSTGPGTSVTTDAGTVIIPAATSGANAATSVVPTATNAVPSFLQGGVNQQTQGIDALTQLLEALGLGRQQQDPELVKAQTILAQQQAMQVARGNEAARAREANQAAIGYLQSQIKEAAKYKTGTVGQTLTNRYADRLKVLQSGQDLNWLTMPSSSFSTPRRSGWTGPATPGIWSI